MRIMALAVIATVAGANPGFAQFRQQTAEKTGFGFTADILFAQVGGSVGDSVGSGFGAAGGLFFQPAGTPARLGVGGSYTRFSTDGPGDALNKTSIYAQAAWQIVDRETSVIPYVQGTVGYTRLSDDEFCSELICGAGTTLRGRVRSGFELGANVGVDVPLSEAVNIDVAGSFSWLRLGDLEVAGQKFGDTSTHASTFGIRAGITVFPR
ncbi:MAG: hypothetical protein OEM96_05240 [Gemmatimonadota bacterium]|nr:hypothetical protein [Gemmatimonadota bacterium]